MRGGGANSCLALKCDIRHYFPSIDHEVLFSIVGRRITDADAMWLIKTIVQSHKTETPGKGLPLGNLTSQFFANLYLAELDNFAKHELRAKYYLRYVDDFVILSKSMAQLEEFKSRISVFLQEKLKLSLHKDKSRIIQLSEGVPWLGFRVFPTHKLLRESNRRKMKLKLWKWKTGLADGTITREEILAGLAGWNGYAKMANTFRLRRAVLKEAENLFQ